MCPVKYKMRWLARNHLIMTTFLLVAYYLLTEQDLHSQRPFFTSTVSILAGHWNEPFMISAVFFLNLQRPFAITAPFVVINTTPTDPLNIL